MSSYTSHLLSQLTFRHHVLDRSHRRGRRVRWACCRARRPRGRIYVPSLLFHLVRRCRGCVQSGLDLLRACRLGKVGTGVGGVELELETVFRCVDGVCERDRGVFEFSLLLWVVREGESCLSCFHEDFVQMKIDEISFHELYSISTPSFTPPYTLTTYLLHAISTKTYETQ